MEKQVFRSQVYRTNVYKCNVCGNIAEVMHPASATLFCCGQPMELKNDNAHDGDRNKHLPVIEKTKDGYKVTIGKEPHPMTDEHHIAWIQILADDKTYTHFLKPGDAPETVFTVQADRVTVRAYSTNHGVWKNSL